METNLLTPDNPLYTPTKTSTPATKKTIDKKVLILIILGAVIFVLLILSIIVSSVRNTRLPITNKPAPTSIPVTPTLEVKAIPTQYHSITNQIEAELKTQLEFLPPAIDETIGQ